MPICMYMKERKHHQPQATGTGIIGMCMGMGIRVKGKLSEHRGDYICTKTIICKFKYWTPKQLYISLDISFSNITF